MKVKNQTEQVLSHLLTHGKITSFQAIEKYKITRLADKIFRLKKSGYKIESKLMSFKDNFGNKSRYSIYTLLENE